MFITKKRKVKITRMLNEFKLLAPSPLRHTKQVELNSKWRPSLLKETAVMPFPKPSDEITQFVK